MIVTCTVCGKEFEAQKTTKKYCSTECMNTARRKKYADMKAAGINPHAKSLPAKECPLCGKTFTPKTPAANQRICCYDCMPDGV